MNRQYRRNKAARQADRVLKATKVQRLRRDGVTFREISEMLDIPQTTTKRLAKMLLVDKVGVSASEAEDPTRELTWPERQGLYYLDRHVIDAWQKIFEAQEAGATVKIDKTAPEWQALRRSRQLYRRVTIPRLVRQGRDDDAVWDLLKTGDNDAWLLDEDPRETALSYA
jgi:hypothetical protein